MFKILTKIAVILVVLSVSACTNAVTKVEEITTTDGHVFQYYQLSDEKDISISVAWKSDAMLLGDVNSVIPHIALDLMLQTGAGGKAPAEIAADFSDLNSVAQLSPNPNLIRGVVMTNAENLMEVAKITNLILTQPNFDQKMLDRVKSNLKNRVLEMQKTGDYRAGEIARNIILNNQQLEDFWSTPIDKISSITLEQIKQWHKSNFATNDLVITASGPVSSDEIAKAIDVFFKDLPKESAQKPFSTIEFNVAPKTIVLIDESATDVFVIAFGSLPNTKQKKDFETLIALYVLGQSDQSRLFKTIREEQRATYGFGSSMVDFMRDKRLMILSGKLDREDIDKSLLVIKNSYEEFRTQGVTQDEFSFARDLFVDQVKMNIKKPNIVSFVVLESLIDGFNSDEFLTLEKMLTDLDQTQINDYIKVEFPKYENLLKVIVINDASKIKADCVIANIDEVAKCL